MASHAQLRTLGVIAVLGPLLFGLAAVVTPVLRPGDGIVRRSISSFAVGSYGWVQRSTFFFLGAGSLALAWGLRSTLAPTRAARAGTALVAVWGVGAVLGGVFPADDARRTVHGVVVTVSFVAIVAGVGVLAVVFRRHPWWSALAPPSAVLGLTAAVTCLLVALTRSSWFGVSERLFIASVLTWLILAGGRLLRPTAGDPGGRRVSTCG